MAYIQSPRPESPKAPPLILRRRYEIRAVLLGSVAALALAGMNGGGLSQARAATPQTEVSQTVSPTSFADVVDHVRGAVVSVKVKTTETADADDEVESPHIVPGDPLERFFKHFGEEGGKKAARAVVTQAACHAGARLGIHHLARRLYGDEQPCRRECDRGFGDLGRWQDCAGKDRRDR